MNTLQLLLDCRSTLQTVIFSGGGGPPAQDIEKFRVLGKEQQLVHVLSLVT